MNTQPKQFSKFTDYWQTLNWVDLSLRLRAKTTQDVERALNSNQARLKTLWR